MQQHTEQQQAAGNNGSDAERQGARTLGASTASLDFDLSPMSGDVGMFGFAP